MTKEQTVSTVDTRLRQLIVEQMGLVGPEADFDQAASFTEHLGMDSLDFVELQISAEEEFGIEIPDEDFETLATFQDAVTYLSRRTAVPAGK
jgi:acyl carrier protein